MKIRDVRVTPVSVPVQAPLRYSTGSDSAIHRLVVEVETDQGLVGLGECNAGVAREERLRGSIPLIICADRFNTERLTAQIVSPAEARLFEMFNHAFAVIYVHCLDIDGQFA